MEEIKEKLVMLIDDNPVDNFIHKTYIQNNSICDQFVIFGTAYEAMDYLKQNSRILAKIPDLILLDINLPAVNGHDFLKEFESLSPEIKEKSKIIIISSSDKEEDVLPLTGNPRVKKYIVKPISDDDLNDIGKVLK